MGLPWKCKNDFGPVLERGRFLWSQKLSLVYLDKGTSGTQLAVMSGELAIGFISKGVLSVVAGRAVCWHWTLYLSAAPRGFQHHGNADTLEEAKAQVEKNWQLWCAAAGLAYPPA